MSIADKITSIEGHLTSDYEGLENIGADLTNIDKNIYNIRTCLDNIYSNIPKTTGEGSNLSLSTIKGRINVDDILGDIEQEGTPTPSTPIDIEVVTGTQEVVVQNKNLFNKNTTKTGYLIQVNGEEVANASYGASDYIPILANTQYVRQNCNNYYGAFYDKNKQFVSAITNANVISSSVDGYVRISFLLTNIDIVQLELGSTATDFVEHQEQTKTLHLSSKNLLEGLELGDINAQTGVEGASTTVLRSTNYIPYDTSKTYYASVNNVRPSKILNLRFYNKSKQYIGYSTLQGSGSNFNVTTGSGVTTTDLTPKYFRIRSDISLGAFSSLTDENMISNYSSLTYEPYYNYELGGIGTYIDRIFETSGKNKLDISKFEEHYTLDGTTGLPVYNAGQTRLTNTTPIDIEGIESLTLTYSYTTSSAISFIYSLLDSNNTLISRVAGNSSGTTITIGQAKYLYICFYDNATLTSVVKPMLSTDNSSYEPYGTDKWYIEKNIKKRTYASNEIVQVNGLSYTNLTYFSIPKSTDSIDYNNFATSIALFDKYLIQNVVNWDSTNNIDRISNRANALTYWIGVPLGTNIETYRTQVGEIINYYILTTPTYTEITNSTLLNELNELEKMMSYNGTTNLSISGNLPMLLSVSALKGE